MTFVDLKLTGLKLRGRQVIIMSVIYIAPLVPRLIMQHMKSSLWSICVNILAANYKAKHYWCLGHGAFCTAWSRPWVYQNNQTRREPQSAHWKLDNIKLWGFDLPPIVQIYADRCFNIPRAVLQDSNHQDHMLLHPTGSEKQRRSLEIQITDSKQVIFGTQTTPATRNADLCILNLSVLYLYTSPPSMLGVCKLSFQISQFHQTSFFSYSASLQ